MDETTRALLDAMEILGELTPLKTDCGRLCGGACCRGDDNTGMILFPGEEALLKDCDFGRIIPAGFRLDGEPARLFVCGGSCPREKRPMACRLFPLFLRFRRDGSTRVTLDPRAGCVCPLPDYGLYGLDEAFVGAARAAYDRLLRDPRQARFLHELSGSCSL